MTDYDRFLEENDRLRTLTTFSFDEPFEFGEPVPGFILEDDTGVFAFIPRMLDDQMVVECYAFDRTGNARVHLHLNPRGD